MNYITNFYKIRRYFAELSYIVDAIYFTKDQMLEIEDEMNNLGIISGNFWTDDDIKDIKSNFFYETEIKEIPKHREDEYKNKFNYFNNLLKFIEDKKGLKDIAMAKDAKLISLINGKLDNVIKK